MTLVSGARLRILLAASRPFISGIATASTTTSGLTSWIRSRATLPLSASKTSQSDWSARREHRKCLRIRWPSTTRIVAGIDMSEQGYGGGRRQGTTTAHCLTTHSTVALVLSIQDRLYAAGPLYHVRHIYVS